jgi:hypothetical protein
MNLDKDTYEYLLAFADDKTIVQALSVNRKFSDPVFFERIFKRKYTLLIQYKTRREDWKHFYLDMIKYISKLKEEYDFPYIPSSRFNPRTFYISSGRSKDKWNLGLFYSAEIGDFELVKYMIGKGANKFSEAISFAVENRGPNNIQIIDYLIKEGEITDLNLNGALEWAARVGNLPIVKYLLQKVNLENINIRKALQYAKIGKHAQVVEYLSKFL